MSGSVSSSENLFSSESARREEILVAFERAWFRGERPEIADYLEGDGPARRELLVELVQIDLEFCLKAGEPVRVESYFARFPELRGDEDALVELLCTEFALRRRREPDLHPGEYVRRFPQLGRRLERRLADGSVASDCRVVIEVVAGPHRGLRWRQRPSAGILAPVPSGGLVPL
jgi:hypothetical protein